MRVDYDVEILGVIDMARNCASPFEQEELTAQVRQLIEELRAGLNLYPHLDNALRLLDPDLRVRNKNGTMIIERYHNWAGAWSYICDWPRHPDTLPFSGEQCADLLRANDMQREGPLEWAKKKREAAAKVREANEKKSSDRILEVIDSLSEKQVQNFLQVEKAMRTGETIRLHGQDEKTFERLQEGARKRVG